MGEEEGGIKSTVAGWGKGARGDPMVNEGNGKGGEKRGKRRKKGGEKTRGRGKSGEGGGGKRVGEGKAEGEGEQGGVVGCVREGGV